jgi:hypothetical protein
MANRNIDEAFEWLIVMLGIVSAILSQYPQYFYSFSPSVDRPLSLRAAMSIVPPIVITIVIWLIGKISSRNIIQAVTKVISWIFVLGITWANLWSYFSGIIIAELSISPFDYPNWLGAIGFFIFSLTVTYFGVIPKYREMYPELSFLKSKIKFLVTYGVTNILLFMLIMSIY